MSKFTVWVDDSNVLDSVLSFDEFATNIQTVKGFQPKTKIESKLVNSALRSATLVTTALMNVVDSNNTLSFTSSLSEVQTILSNKINNKLLKYDSNSVNYDSVYCRDANSNEFKLKICTENSDPWSIVRRDGGGGIHFTYLVIDNDDQPIGNKDATPKHYVDEKDDYIKNNVTMKDRTFNNPVLINSNASDYFPDPTVWGGDDGYFYAAATGFEKPIYRSVDLVHWTSCNKRLILSEDETTIRNEMNGGVYTKMWAPSVYKVGNKWLLYISVVVAAQIESTKSAIYVLSSNRCDGSFTSPVKLFDNTTYNVGECIDPFLDCDPLTNELQLYFGSTGGIHRIDMNPDGLSVKENATPTYVAGSTIASDPNRDNVCEGTFIYYRNGYKFLFMSSGKTWENSYKLRVSRASSTITTQNTTVWANFYNKDGTPLSTTPGTIILSNSTGQFNSPGHNGNIFVDREGKTYMFYHCHTENYVSGQLWKRAMFLQELKWTDDNWPYFENGVPASTEKCPYLPQIQRIEYGG